MIKKAYSKKTKLYNEQYIKVVLISSPGVNEVHKTSVKCNKRSIP